MLVLHEPGHYVLSCFDIDSFKVVNDQYGADKGDEVLKHVAQSINGCVHTLGGICCRHTSDKFAILYPAEYMDSDIVRENHREASNPPCIDRTIKIRIGRYIVSDLSLPISAMYDRAALAEESIRGRYDVYIANYQNSMREQLLHEQMIVREMSEALLNSQFEPWFQPQYNHVTGALIGAEVLARWRHPKKGLIEPGLFIPVFERNGFIYELDKYVWEQTCALLHKWINEGRNPLPVSVNISRQDVFRPDFFEVITNLTQKYSIPVHLLRLEITESAFAKSTEQIVSMVKKLMDFGFTVEIDDFGSGYSSFNTLKDIPASILKLDMNFLESADDSQRGGNILESIIRMAKWLGMSVIAEGVETVEQADFLKSIGCNYLQGYLYARPMPVADYEALWRGVVKEEKMVVLETVEHLDNNRFWDPKAMDALIFNSYVGGAFIFEYRNGSIEILRISDNYVEELQLQYYENDSFATLDLFHYMDEDGKKSIRACALRAISTGREQTGEAKLHKSDGRFSSTQYIRLTMRMIAKAGEHLLFYCVIDNITEQRRAEQKERESARQLQAIMDNVNSGVSASYFQGGLVKYIFANDKFYELLGYTKEQYQQQFSGIMNMIHPEDRARVAKRDEQGDIDRKPFTVEFRILRPDGMIRWMTSNVAIMDFPGIATPVHLAVTNDVTAERQAEQEKLSAAAQMRTLMEDTPTGFACMSIGPDGQRRPAFFNDKLCKLFGMNRDKITELYKNDSLAGVHPDDIPIVNEAVAKMIETGEAHSYRYRLRYCHDGYIWVYVFGRVTKNELGERFLNLYYTDATEQVKAEEQRIALLENLPCGACLYRAVGNTIQGVYLNKRYRSYFSREIVDLDTAPMLEMVHPDDVPRLMKALHTAITANSVERCDARIINGKGGYILFSLTGTVLSHDEDGSTLICVTYMPITEEELSYREMLPIALSAIMESTGDLSFVKDKNLRYISASREFINMVGLADEKALIGKTDYDIFDQALADKYRHDDEQLLKNRQSIIDMLETIPSTDGSHHYSSTSKYLLYDASGNVIGLYGSGRDITQTRNDLENLRLLTESIPGGLATFEVGPDGVKLLYFNEGFYLSSGYSREEYEALSANDPFAQVFEEDRPLILAAVKRLTDGAVRNNSASYRCHSKDGGFRWFSMTGTVAERHGASCMVNAVKYDITEHKELEQSLRISEEESRLAASLSGNAIARFDIAARSMTVTPEVAKRHDIPEKITGVPYEQVRQGMLSPESEQAYANFYEEIINGGRSGKAVYQHKTSQGWRWEEARYQAVLSDDGESRFALISMADVTDQVEKESIAKKWQQSLGERSPEDYTLFRCNISKGTTFDTREGQLLRVKFAPGEFNFDDHTEEYAVKYVVQEDCESFKKFLNSGNMLASYYRGKRSATLEYREILSKDAFRWLRLTVELVEYPNSTDVEAFLMFEDVDEEKREELKTRELAETDPLTGILNRKAFTEKTENILSYRNPDSLCALFMLDLDGFKMINDSFGHAIGDKTLIEVGQKLSATFRSNDLVGRLGGDEFILCLCEIPSRELIARKAQHLCTLLHKSFSCEVQLSASIGIAICPDDGSDFETLYHKADLALYHVKAIGKDNFVFYSDDMSEEAPIPRP